MVTLNIGTLKCKQTGLNPIHGYYCGSVSLIDKDKDSLVFAVAVKFMGKRVEIIRPLHCHIC